MRNRLDGLKVRDMDKNKKRVAKYSRGSVALSRGKFTTAEEKAVRKKDALAYFDNESKEDKNESK